MSLYWIYDLPNWQLGLLIVGVFNAVAVSGLFLTRPITRRLLRASGEHNDVVSWFFAAVGVFYGLAMGLIAVGTWEDYSSVDALVGNESAALAGLYRDFDGYPLELRRQFEANLRTYAEEIIRVEWTAHRLGLTPPEGAKQLDDLENLIMAYEPRSDREKIVHTEVLQSLNHVVQARVARTQSVGTALPAALWSVVLIGALLNFVLLYLFWVDNQALHIVLISLFATFVALLIFLTAAMDNPYRGEFSVSPDAIQSVVDTVMTPPNPGKAQGNATRTTP